MATAGIYVSVYVVIWVPGGAMGFEALATNALSTLGIHVGHVVGLGTKEQVLSIAARWVITVVEHVEPIGGSLGKGPRKTMGKNHLPVGLDSTVAVSTRAARPLLTPTRHRDNVTPQPLGKVHARIITTFDNKRLGVM